MELVAVAALPGGRRQRGGVAGIRRTLPAAHPPLVPPAPGGRRRGGRRARTSHAGRRAVPRGVQAARPRHLPRLAPPGGRQRGRGLRSPSSPRPDGRRRPAVLARPRQRRRAGRRTRRGVPGRLRARRAGLYPRAWPRATAHLGSLRPDVPPGPGGPRGGRRTRPDPLGRVQGPRPGPPAPGRGRAGRVSPPSRNDLPPWYTCATSRSSLAPPQWPARRRVAPGRRPPFGVLRLPGRTAAADRTGAGPAPARAARSADSPPGRRTRWCACSDPWASWAAAGGVACRLPEPGSSRPNRVVAF